jgi:Flp pilus assembly protein TadG
MTADEGSLSAFLAFFGVTLFVLVGLVVDGGRALASRRQAIDVAEQAARTGADQLNVDSLRKGTYIVDPAAAEIAAEHALATSGLAGTVSVSGDEVTVEVRTVMHTAILGIVGLRAISVSGTATAVDVHGVTRAEG